MVIVAGSFVFEPGQREQFLDDRLALMQSSRAEEGCFEYTFGADPLDDSRVVLYERWASQEALDTHIAGMRATPPPTGSGVVPKSASIMVYDASGERPLGR